MALIRSIRLWDLVAVVVNSVIGAGIFGLPSRVFAISGTYSLVAFVACALCTSLIVLTAIEVASRFSTTGGPYLFAHETYGVIPGFIVGWLVFIARVTSFAANCTLLPDYLGFFFPAVATGALRVLILTAVVMLMVAVNFRGIRYAANFSNIFAIGKLLPLAIFIGVGLFFLNPHRLALTTFPGYHPFSQTVLLLVYAFTGFEMALIPAGETKNPQKNTAPALLIGMLVVVVVYVAIQIVCIGALPGLAHSTRPLADAAAQFLGPPGAALITLGILVSLAGNLNVVVLSASRILFAMAERGELPSPLARVSPRYHTPAVAVLFTGVVVLILTLSGTFIYLLTLSTLARLITYIAMCGALPVLRFRPKAPPAMFRLRFGVTISLLAILLSLWLFSNSTLNEIRNTAIAAAIGLVIFALHRLISVRAQ